MYNDRHRVRDHIEKIRFSDYEEKLIEKAVQLTGEQKATLLRICIMEQLERLLAAEGKNNGDDSGIPPQRMGER